MKKVSNNLAIRRPCYGLFLRLLKVFDGLIRLVLIVHVALIPQVFVLNKGLISNVFTPGHSCPRKASLVLDNQ